jgi:quercetin dioxygenase-like cupin family protein
MYLALAAAFLLTIEGRAQEHEQAAGAAAAAKHVVILPSDVKWEDMTALPPGAKAALLEGDPSKDGFFTIRAKFPDGYKIPPHFHPRPERVTVLSGTFHLGTGDKFDKDAAKTLPTGSYTSMPAEMHHFAWAEGETIVQISTMGPWGITYLNPADDPRKSAK